MLKPHRDPYGYKHLLAYQKAEELQAECRKLTSRFPKTKTMIDLADQMDRSARSVKQNIVEGWKRNTTKEYDTFLGYSIAANAELEEDCKDIINGVHYELKGKRRLKGLTGAMAEKLRFYPLDPNLPPIVQLYLRCKEINYLISKIQKSLVDKMAKEGTMTQADKLKIRENQEKKEKEWLNKHLEASGFIKQSDGTYLSPTVYKRIQENKKRAEREEREKRGKGE